MSEPFIAEIKMFGGNFAPRGYAFCEGQILPISQNTALFSLVGTIYGGDGRTTYGLPDLRGRTPLHVGNGPGLTPRPIGQRGGTEQETLSQQQLPQHTHTLNAVAAPGDATSPGGGTLAQADGANLYAAGPNRLMASETSSDVGGGQPHTNLQPSLAISFIIALFGIYPSRS